MKFVGVRRIGSAVLLVLLAEAGCNRTNRTSSESTPKAVRVSITMHTPDAFYELPADLPRKPGALLRSEPLKDVVLPAGVRGWRILYASSVDDNTPATAVATLFAPIDPPTGPRPAHRSQPLVRVRGHEEAPQAAVAGALHDGMGDGAVAGPGLDALGLLGHHYFSTTCRPIARAEPSMIRAAASISLALRSFIFFSAISRSWVRVTLPTVSRPVVLAPDFRPEACLR